jgi:iron complex outermembrane receptor protein
MKQMLSGASAVAIAAGLWSGFAVQAQAQATAAEEVEAVIVTGTARRDLTVLSSPTPIDVVGAATLEKTGQVSLTQALRTAVPSASFAQTGGIIGARLANSVSLRGLPAGNTLVLVNGKRRNPTSKVSTGNEWSRGSQPVDVNDIPIEAVARVEVLRDGASAQYGSDAIAGVVNIILRGNDKGGYAQATWGQFYEGDGASRDVSGWYTVPLGSRGFLNLTTHLHNNGTTDRDNRDIRTYYFAGDPREATANKDFGFYGNPLSRSIVSSLNGEFELADKLTAYATATGVYRTSINKYFIRPAADNNVRALYPNGTMTDVKYASRNYDGVAGLRYDAGSLGSFDFSIEYGHGRQSSSMYNSLNATYGTASQRNFFLGAYNQEQLNIQLDYLKDVAVGWSSNPVTVSAAAGYRHEKFYITAGEPASYNNGGVLILDGPNAGRRPPPGAADFGGLTPDDATNVGRDVYFGFVGLEQKLTDQLQVGGAVRFEDFSDFGSKATGKFSARYDFLPSFGIRGAVSTGYHAPTTGQMGASSTTLLWIQPTTGPQFLGISAFYPAANRVARALGAKDLKPETSVNLSAGFVARPLPGLSIELDAYQIKIDDVILPSDSLTGAGLAAKLAPFGITDVSAVRFFVNQADVTAKGVDVVIRYRWDWDGVGAFDLSLAGNTNASKIRRILPNPPELAGTGLVLVGRVSQGYLTRWSPKDKFTASLRYTRGPFEVGFNAVRYGKYRNTAGNAVNDQVFSPQWVANLSLSYSFWHQTKVTVGANNLFDSYPDAPYAQNRFNGFNNYDLQAPEGGNGGYYYVSLSKRF